MPTSFGARSTSRAAPSGDVYVNTWSSSYTELKNAPGGYLVALRDTNRDDKADQIERFGPHQDGKAGGGTVIAMHGDGSYADNAESCAIGSSANGWSRMAIQK